MQKVLLFTIFLCSFFVAVNSDLLGTVQSIAVRGTLMCAGVPANGTKVKLYDHDSLDPDDLLDEDYTDDNGQFELSGSETEISDIDPRVNVYHDCKDEDFPCLLKFHVEIPDEYITHGNKVPKRTFDVGILNLEGTFSGQSRDCIN